ncbi:MAG: hypothetical protein KGL35_15405, partial [Bradyrhizobium sp.]|nr:hypothetical protein [Bradyrhizobium sp.]
MANWLQWGDDEERIWQEWLATRPPVIRELAPKFPPYKLFRLTTTGQRCFVIGYSEDRTLQVQIDGAFNLVSFARQVFGIDPDTLVECELPAEGELLGDVSAAI